MLNRREKTIVIRLTLFLAILEGVFVVWNLLRAPSETQAIVLMNYSFARLVLLSGVLAVLLAVLYLLVRSFRVNWFDQGFGKSLDNALDGSGIFWGLLACGGVMYFLDFASAQKLGSFASYRERLYPILLWFALITLQTLTGFIYIRSRRSHLVQVYRGTILPSGVVLGLFALLIIFISLTKIGLSPDLIYWQGPGVPVMVSQVFMALLIGLLFNFVLFRFGALSRTGGNVGICICLWVLAAFLWWSQPARISYNSLAPSYPNFQSYPFGDAILYDTVAHDVLAGTALPGDFWVKPLYSGALKDC